MGKDYPEIHEKFIAMQTSILYKGKYLDLIIEGAFIKGTPGNYLYPGDPDEWVIENVFYVSEVQDWETSFNIWDWLPGDVQETIYDRLYNSEPEVDYFNERM